MPMWFLRSFFTIYNLHLRILFIILCISLLNHYGWNIGNIESLSTICVAGHDYTQDKE
jgi:hypothetical protein